MTPETAEAALFRFFRQLVGALVDRYPEARETVSITVRGVPRGRKAGARVEVTVPGRKAREEHTIPVMWEDWDRWARDSSREWWSLSAAGMTVLLDGEPVPPAFITHRSYQLWADVDESTAVHLKAGSPPVLYEASDDGLEHVRYLPTPVGGTAYVRDSSGTEGPRRALLHHQLVDRRTAEFDGQLHYHPSTSRTGHLLIEEVQRGVHHDLLEGLGRVLRQRLPALKVGVPSVKDVRSKLAMESKLRVDQQVTGSLRPLVFTLEALEGSASPGEYPGLWASTSDTATAIDVRSHFQTMLLWDSALHVLAAACRFHGEFKSGVTLGGESSRTVFVTERRYSKRDSGEVESVYLQVNPTRIAGNAHEVAVRILQWATHELAHAATYGNIRHPEIFTTRREQFLTAGAVAFPILVMLAEVAGAEGSRHKPVAERPYTTEQFLADEMLAAPQGALVEFLALRWAAIRNISLAKADAEVTAELSQQVLAGRATFLYGDSVVQARSR